MKVPILTTLLLVLLAFTACKDDDGPVPPKEPSFSSSDVDLFWEVFDATDVPASVDFQEQYVDRGSVGLQDFARQKNLAPTLKSVLREPAYLQYYEAVRENTRDLSTVDRRAEAAFRELKRIYPATKFYDVYYLVGAMTAGGRVSENGLLIAVEMFCKNEDTPLGELSEWHQNVLRNKDYLPSIVVHEFLHLQQTFRPNNQSLITTLEQSVREGLADFISHHLLADRPFMNEHLHTYGDPREEALWDEFRAQKDTNFRETEWLYGGKTTATGHPADMGYYVGYKILEAFAATFDDPEDAIVAMLTTGDYEALFERSGYEDKFR